MHFNPLQLVAASVLASCVASTGAAAWQRPKAQPAAKVEACPSVGEGYVKLPGTDTCVRLGGSVRVEAMHANGAASFYPDGR